MEWTESVTGVLEELLSFAQQHGLMEAVDRPYYRNLLMDAAGLDAPAGDVPDVGTSPATATELLRRLCDLMVEKGRIEDMQYARDLFSARVMGLLTPSPREVREAFRSALNSGNPQAATQGFYEMCRACDYIKVDSIAQNIRYFADSSCGRL